MLAGEPAEPLDRDLGVLVEAEDVLQRNDSLGERPRPPRVEIGEELQRIPEPLAPDSYPMVLGRRRVTLDLLGRLAKRRGSAPRSGPAPPPAPAARPGRSDAREPSAAGG